MMPGPDQDRDRLIDEITRQLKQPVPMDPGLQDRVMSAINRTGRSWWPLAWSGLALAAGLGILAFFLGRSEGRVGSHPGVAFSLDAPGASQVSLVGDFNNWDPAATPLVRVSDRGRWEAVVPLTPGRYYFTFVVDGRQWVRDPLLPQAVGDDFGQPTSVITVTTLGRT
jgi:hypothetical protein